MFGFKVVLCILFIHFLQFSIESEIKYRNLSSNVRNFSFSSNTTMLCPCLNSSPLLNLTAIIRKQNVQLLKICPKRAIELEKTFWSLLQKFCDYSCNFTFFTRSCANELWPFLKKEARENFTYTTWNNFIENLDIANISHNELYNPCVLFVYIFSAFTLFLPHAQNVYYLFQIPFCPLQDYVCFDISYFWKAIPQK